MNQSPRMMDFSPRDIQVAESKGLDRNYIVIGCFVCVALLSGVFAGMIAISFLSGCSDGCSDCKKGIFLTKPECKSCETGFILSNKVCSCPLGAILNSDGVCECPEN